MTSTTNLREATCGTCGETFTPADDTDTEHAVRLDGTECGGTALEHDPDACTYPAGCTGCRHTGADVVGEELAEHYDRGVAVAAEHATRASLVDPTRTGLSSWAYARRMSDTAAADGDHEQAAYWAGYSAEARRIDPDSTRQLST